MCVCVCVLLCHSVCRVVFFSATRGEIGEKLKEETKKKIFFDPSAVRNQELKNEKKTIINTCRCQRV